MAEKLEFPVVLLAETSQDGFAFQQVLGELRQGCFVEIQVRIGVIAQLEPGIKPSLEQCKPLFVQAPVLFVKLPQVNEADGRNTVLFQAPEQL